MKKLTILIFSIIQIHSQENVNINGFIRDNETGEPISYANVFLTDTNFGTSTNIDGYFVLLGVPIGQYEFNVNIIGYKHYKGNIIFSTHDEGQYDFDYKFGDAYRVTSNIFLTLLLSHYLQRPTIVEYIPIPGNYKIDEFSSTLSTIFSEYIYTTIPVLFRFVSGTAVARGDELYHHAFLLIIFLKYILKKMHFTVVYYIILTQQNT